MKNVDLYLKVRHAVRIEGLSERATARRFGIDPRTVNKMMKFSVPPGYVRKKPPAKPKLNRFIPVIDGILGDDKSRPKKQQHTAKRIFERLRDEHGFTGEPTRGRADHARQGIGGWECHERRGLALRNKGLSTSQSQIEGWGFSWLSRSTALRRQPS